MCDFEKAVVNSVKKHFPKASVGGCYFHLTSNIWKYVKNNGLKTVFSNDLEFSKTFYYLKVLPFVPSRDIIKVFEKIKSLAPQSSTTLLEYFEKNYIGLSLEDEPRIRKVPLFPIKTWNLQNRILNDLRRSNNSLEAWHQALSNDINSHPGINKLIHHL